MWLKKKVVVAFCVCFFFVFALQEDEMGTSPEKPQEDSLSEEEHFKEDEHNPDYDAEAFLGEKKEEFDNLSPEEAQRRLKILLKQVDSDSDSYVTSEELKVWVNNVFKKKMARDMQRNLQQIDKDSDGFIDWKEFLKENFGDKVSPDDNKMKKMFDRVREFYDAADANKDGKLNSDEFGSFLHPETNPEMQLLNAAKSLEDMDKNNDSRLDLDEFLGDYKDPESGSPREPVWAKEETERFKNELDKNKDGLLDAAELTVWMTTDTDATIVEKEVKHLIDDSDDNKDGKLSEEEVIAHHNIFLGSEATDYGQALPKEEL